MFGESFRVFVVGPVSNVEGNSESLSSEGQRGGSGNSGIDGQLDRNCTPINKEELGSSESENARDSCHNGEGDDCQSLVSLDVTNQKKTAACNTVGSGSTGANFQDLSIENKPIENVGENLEKCTMTSGDKMLSDISNIQTLVSALNKATEESNYVELDKIVNDIDGYEGISVVGLDGENFKNFCLQHLNLKLQKRSDYQHIFSNILCTYKFNTESYNHDYSVKELVLLAIAANDKLAEKYHDVLFAEENLSLFPLFVGNQRYIEIFIEKFPNLYQSLKEQTIKTQCGQVSFFSAIALRKEQNLLDSVFVEYASKDLEKVLQTGNPDSLYGILETASLTENREFIKIVLNSIERHISDPVKADLLQKCITTLLETTINCERTLIVEHLCKQYVESEGSVVQKIYEEAFKDNGVIEVFSKQILGSIKKGSSSVRKGKKDIYNLILSTVSRTGNTEFIAKILNFIESDEESLTFLQNSLAAILENAVSAKSVPVIEYLFEKYNENIISELRNKKIKNRAVLNILNGVEELVKKAIDAKDVKLLSFYVNVVKAGVICAQPEEGLPAVKKIKEVVDKFAEEQGEPWSCHPDMPIVSHMYDITQSRDYISREEYRKVEHLQGNLNRAIVFLSNNKKNNNSIESNSGSQKIKGNPLETKKESDTISRMEVLEESSNSIRKGGDMGNSKKKQNPRSIKERLSYATERISYDAVRSIVEQEGENLTKSILDEALNEAKARNGHLKKGRKKSQKKFDNQNANLMQIIALLQKRLDVLVDAEPSVDNGGTEGVSDNNHTKVGEEIPALLNGMVEAVGNNETTKPSFPDDEVFYDAEENNDNCQQVEIEGDNVNKEPEILVRAFTVNNNDESDSVKKATKSSNSESSSVENTELEKGNGQNIITKRARNIQKVVVTDKNENGLASEKENEQKDDSQQVETNGSGSHGSGQLSNQFFDSSVSRGNNGGNTSRIVTYNNGEAALVEDVDDESVGARIFDSGERNTQLKVLVTGYKPNRVDDEGGRTYNNGRQPSNLGKNNAASQGIKNGKWPAVSISALAVATVATPLIMYFAFQSSTLATGVVAAGLGICLIVAAVVYYCSPKSSVENNNVTKVIGEELAV
ncbi:MAG: hypothetical protein PV340_04140 [Wolbachia sp.]|nr:hypothetical protein [Wolbachia sp.]MDD9336400.1 hypothetical protein [Wolbachia sp.]